MACWILAALCVCSTMGKGVRARSRRVSYRVTRYGEQERQGWPDESGSFSDAATRGGATASLSAAWWLAAPGGSLAGHPDPSHVRALQPGDRWGAHLSRDSARGGHLPARFLAAALGP